MNIYGSGGYLKIILGPMFSGKTSELFKIYDQLQFLDIKCIVINHSSDTRYSTNTELVSHNNIKIPCYHTNRLDNLQPEIVKQIEESQYILINEGQFFTDLYDWVVDKLNNHNKHIYISGLDGDFKKNKFGQILDLIPQCDEVIKMHAFCTECKNGQKAIFTHRTIANNTQILIGEKNIYVSLCRNCYKLKNSI